MKNQIITLVFVLIASILNAKSLELVDIIYQKIDHNVGNLSSASWQADENGGRLTFNLDRCGGESYQLKWTFSSDIKQLTFDEAFITTLERATGPEACWYAITASISNEPTGGPHASARRSMDYGKWTDYLNMSRNSPSRQEQGLIPREYSSIEYTAFSVSVGHSSYFGHSVYYIYKKVDEETTSKGDCKSGNCANLYAMSYNAGATHIRLGHSDPRSQILDNLDNTISSAKSSGCFDVSYLKSLRYRIASEGKSVRLYLGEFETFMHGIPAQIASDCPCCLPCGEQSNPTPESCHTPLLSEIWVQNVKSNSASLRSSISSSQITYQYGKNGGTWQMSKTGSLTNLLPNTKYFYRAKRLCGSSDSDFSDYETFTTGSAAASCAKPDISLFQVKLRTSSRVEIDANVEASHYYWRVYIGGKLVTADGSLPGMWVTAGPNTEIAIYLKVKCHNGLLSEE